MGDTYNIRKKKKKEEKLIEKLERNYQRYCSGSNSESSGKPLPDDADYNYVKNNGGEGTIKLFADAHEAGARGRSLTKLVNAARGYGIDLEIKDILGVILYVNGEKLPRHKVGILSQKEINDSFKLGKNYITSMSKKKISYPELQDIVSDLEKEFKDRKTSLKRCEAIAGPKLDGNQGYIANLKIYLESYADQQENLEMWRYIFLLK